MHNTRCKRITLFYDILHTFNFDVSQLPSCTVIHISLSRNVFSIFDRAPTKYIRRFATPSVRSKTVKEYCQSSRSKSRFKAACGQKDIYNHDSLFVDVTHRDWFCTKCSAVCRVVKDFRARPSRFVIRLPGRAQGQRNADINPRLTYRECEIQQGYSIRGSYRVFTVCKHRYIIPGSLLRHAEDWDVSYHLEILSPMRRISRYRRCQSYGQLFGHS